MWLDASDELNVEWESCISAYIWHEEDRVGMLDEERTRGDKSYKEGSWTWIIEGNGEYKEDTARRVTCSAILEQSLKIWFSE